MNLLPGDIVFVHGRGWFASLIRRFTRSSGEPETWANHVEIMVNPYQVIGALWRVLMRPIRLAYPDPSTIRIYRHTGLTEQQRWAVAREALVYRNRPYGVAKILAHAADWALGGRYVFRRLIRVDRYPICSYVVGKAYDRAIGYRFGVPAKAASPDDIWDWVTENDKWTRIE